MLEIRDDPNYEDVKTCHLFTALDAAVQIQKKKVIVGPNDGVGIMLFNTVNDRSLPFATILGFSSLNRPGKANQAARRLRSRRTISYTNQSRLSAHQRCRSWYNFWMVCEFLPRVLTAFSSFFDAKPRGKIPTCFEIPSRRSQRRGSPWEMSLRAVTG